MLAHIHRQHGVVAKIFARGSLDVVYADRYRSQVGVLTRIVPVRPEGDILQTSRRAQAARVAHLLLDAEGGHQAFESRTAFEAQAIKLFIGDICFDLIERGDHLRPVDLRLGELRNLRNHGLAAHHRCSQRRVRLGKSEAMDWDRGSAGPRGIQHRQLSETQRTRIGTGDGHRRDGLILFRQERNFDAALQKIFDDVLDGRRSGSKLDVAIQVIAPNRIKVWARRYALPRKDGPNFGEDRVVAIFGVGRCIRHGGGVAERFLGLLGAVLRVRDVVNVDRRQAGILKSASAVYEEANVFVGSGGAFVSRIAGRLFYLYHCFERLGVGVVADARQLLESGVVGEGEDGVEVGSGKIAKIIGVLGNQLWKLEPLRVALGQRGRRVTRHMICDLPVAGKPLASRDAGLLRMCGGRMGPNSNSVLGGYQYY